MAIKVILALLLGCSIAQAAAGPDIERLADAIYRAENSRGHPYGIMKKYAHTSPRQACINTIKHKLRRWNGQGDFIVFLGQTYSPPAINPNWVRLVKYFYAGGRK